MRKKTRSLGRIFFLMFMAMLLCACSGDVSLKTVGYKGYINVGYEDDSYLSESLFEIMKNFASTMDAQARAINTDEYSWQADLHNSKIDIMLDKVNDIDIQSETIYIVKVLMIKPSNTEFLKGGKIGVLDAGVVEKASQDVKSFHECSYDYYARSELLVSDFEAGLLDGIIINEYDYYKYKTIDAVSYDVIYHREVKATLRAADKNLADAFNKYIIDSNTNGEIEEIILGE